MHKPKWWPWGRTPEAAPEVEVIEVEDPIDPDFVFGNVVTLRVSEDYLAKELVRSAERREAIHRVTVAESSPDQSREYVMDPLKEGVQIGPRGGLYVPPRLTRDEAEIVKFDGMIKVLGIKGGKLPKEIVAKQKDLAKGNRRVLIVDGKMQEIEGA